MRLTNGCVAARRFAVSFAAFGLTWLIWAGSAPHAGGAEPAAPATGPASRVQARPATRPGHIQQGDLLVATIGDLMAGKPIVKPMRVEADGAVSIPYIGSMQAAGKTTSELARAIVEGLHSFGIIDQGNARVRRLQLADTLGAVPPGPIVTGDLLRIGIFELAGPGSEDILIVRADASGNVDIPFLGSQKVGGLLPAEAEQSISKAFEQHGLLQHAVLCVLRLEAAPGGAASLNLPDAPLNDVPEPLKPFFLAKP